MSEREPLLDFRTLGDDHKSAAMHIARVAEDNGLTDFANKIKDDFQLVRRKRYKLSDSEFCKFAESKGFFIAVQGMMVEDGVEYPIISLVSDVRNFDKLLEK